MLFHVYADRAREGLIKSLDADRLPHTLVFDRFLASGEACGESDRLLKGFAVFVNCAVRTDVKHVVVFDLLDRIDEAQGETVAELMQPLFAKGVEIHATALSPEGAVAQCVRTAAECVGYRTIIPRNKEGAGT